MTGNQWSCLSTGLVCTLRIARTTQVGLHSLGLFEVYKSKTKKGERPANLRELQLSVRGGKVQETRQEFLRFLAFKEKESSFLTTPRIEKQINDKYIYISDPRSVKETPEPSNELNAIDSIQHLSISRTQCSTLTQSV